MLMLVDIYQGTTLVGEEGAWMPSCSSFLGCFGEEEAMRRLTVLLVFALFACVPVLQTDALCHQSWQGERCDPTSIPQFLH